MAEVTEIIDGKVKVKFNQDDVPSVLEYPKLSSYKPIVGDKVLMLKTNTSFICIGGVGDEPSAVAENPYIVGEYKFFAKDKGLLWKGWAKCDGRELSIDDFPELYAEIGTNFSSSGHFLLPLTTGRVLSDASGETFGAIAGSKSVTLTTSQMPKHNHDLRVGSTPYTGGGYRYAMEAVNSSWATTNHPIQDAGGGSSHENRQPTLYGGYYYIYTGVI